MKNKYIKSNFKEMSIEEIKQCELNIFKSFVDFCNNNNLKYSLAGGTLIGAIRHGGFIPWDDDIDVMMPRDDYEYFLKNFKDDRFYILNIETNKKYWNLYSKLIDNFTTGYESNYRKIKNYGVFIDIFPMDGSPSPKYIKKNIKKFETGLIINSKFFFIYKWKANKLLTIFLIPFSIIRCILFRYILDMKLYYKKNIKILNESKNNKIITFTFDNIFTKMKDLHIDDFNNLIDVEFEGIRCKIISRYDEILSQIYGKYMELPPIEERKNPHKLHFFKKVNND